MTYLDARQARRLHGILCWAFAGWLCAGCAAATRDAGTAPRRRGSFFAISVADVAAMSSWYQDKLTMRVVTAGEAPNKIAKFAILEGNGVLLELIQHAKADDRKVLAPAATEAHLIHGIFKAGMIVDDLDGLYASLKQRGAIIAYDLMPAKDVPMRSFIVRDPEGNLVQFFGE
jgi:catechol 2,3-dioxygenase-like lactoylglutathione lyase family enzyme